MTNSGPEQETICKNWTDCEGDLNGDCFLFGVPYFEEEMQRKFDLAVDCEPDFMDWDDGKLFIMGDHVVFFDGALKMVAAASSLIGAAMAML